MTVARPVPLVNADMVDRLPNCDDWLLTRTSNRRSTFDSGLPLGSLAVTTIVEVELPSWVTWSGVAVMPSESASSDGPASGGGTTSCTVHADVSRTLARTSPTPLRVM